MGARPCKMEWDSCFFFCFFLLFFHNLAIFMLYIGEREAEATSNNMAESVLVSINSNIHELNVYCYKMGN